MMDETEFQRDSMYEMDAPNCVDFNVTDLSVNESIFDKRTVGERMLVHNDAELSNELHKMAFKSPSAVFKDIGNVTPRILRSATKKQRNSPEKEKLECQLSLITNPEPKATPVSTHEDTISIKKSPATPLQKTPGKLALNRAAVSSSSVQSKPPANSLKTRRSNGNKMSPSHPLHVRRSATSEHSMKTRTSSSGRPLQPAHAGTPFKGKKSPMKALRTRTRSQDASADNQSMVRQRSGSTSSLRTRTSSTGNAPSHQPPIRLQHRTSSQSSLSRVVSPGLSRLMKPTESARLKMQELKNANSSPKRKAAQLSSSKPPKLPRNTIPKSPSFLRQSRARITPIKSSEEIELERIEREKNDMKSLRKLNEEGLRAISSGSSRKRHSMTTRADDVSKEVKAKRSIYDVIASNSADAGTAVILPSLSSRAPSPRRDAYTKHRVTKPYSPKLHTKLRERQDKIATTEEREMEERKKQQFKAAPLDKRIFEGPTGIKHGPALPVTAPISLQFETEKRSARSVVKQVEETPVEPTIKAQPVPKMGPVFKPKLEHKRTCAEPFTFESKDEQSKLRRAQLRQRVEEEERRLREFKANPLPPSPSPLPDRLVLLPTVPEPFQLLIDERGEMQQERLKRKIAKENAAMLEATIVHAKPADVLRRQPFRPVKEASKFTEPLNIELSSTRRAAERREYEARKQEAEAKMAEIEAEIRHERERRERQQLAEARSATIIKQAPIKQYKPLQIKQSEKQLTKPRSPQFSKR